MYLVKTSFLGRLFYLPFTPSLRRRGKRGGYFGCGVAALEISTTNPLFSLLWKVSLNLFSM
jgi:hypothetical protein